MIGQVGVEQQVHCLASYPICSCQNQYSQYTYGDLDIAIHGHIHLYWMDLPTVYLYCNIFLLIVILCMLRPEECVILKMQSAIDHTVG